MWRFPEKQSCHACRSLLSLSHFRAAWLMTYTLSQTFTQENCNLRTHVWCQFDVHHRPRQILRHSRTSEQSAIRPQTAKLVVQPF